MPEKKVLDKGQARVYDFWMFTVAHMETYYPHLKLLF